MKYFYAEPLNIAIEKGNFEIIKLLMACDNLNMNAFSILNRQLSYS